ncbi:carbon-nitrogen hydrolase [Hypomontagnella monticulosa]|nr:carbon-nitrogen hydrolase [Hypomontagnella monticulosa]
MKIGLLQFAPQVGDVDNNLNRADAILNKANPEDLDLLVLPEMAFSGYNFQSLRDISPFLEPTGAGITSVWARTTALKHNCTVISCYPERVDVSPRWPTSPEYYNSAILVNQDGDTIGGYRKTHLYYTDETWALEGSGFYEGQFPGIGKVAMGICMDINPYRFEAPWHAFEFAFHVLETRAKLVILSMAWLTTEDLGLYSSKSSEPDLDTLSYWISRLEPLIRAETEHEIIVVFANRTGVEDNAVYAGTSAVIGIQGGEVTVYGLLSRGAKELLIVDTEAAPYAKLVYRPEDGDKSVEASGGEPQVPPSEAGSREGPSHAPTSNAPPNPSAIPGASADSNIEDSDLPVEPAGSSVNSRAYMSPKEYKNSPISPQFFWKQPVYGYEESTDGAVPRSVDLEVKTEFSELSSKITDFDVTEPSIYRPPSTKSRNASRRRRHNSPPISPEEQFAQLMSKGGSRTEKQNAEVVAKGPLSPDLEKLGADLMVFEGDGANRPKRDSLVCHVDEDDYVVLRTERKDIAGKKKSGKPDVHPGRPSSRNSKPNDSPTKGNGRSHSRNKISTESPTYPFATSDSAPLRPASRGRQRSNSTKSPKNLTKKTSQSRIATNGISPVSPPGLDEVQAAIDWSRHNRHRGEGLSSAASPSSHRHRHDPMPSSSKPTSYKSQEPLVEREATLPIRTKHHRKDSRSGIVKGAVSPPGSIEPSSKTRASPIIAEKKQPAPKVIPERVPPTPKAMILPPDYDANDSHTSMPVPPRKQEPVVALKCMDESENVQVERPRSAVW